MLRSLLAASLAACGLCAVSAHATANAPIVANNPRNSIFEVSLLEKENTTVRGWLTAAAPLSGIGVGFAVNFWGFPDDLHGPYFYHIHSHPVPDNGDCYGTGDPFDPYDRGMKASCDAGRPDTCVVGDLSGKHAPIYVGASQPFEIHYADLFLATDAGSPAFFGNRSIVVHDPNGRRLNCGNFVASLGHAKA